MCTYATPECLAALCCAAAAGRERGPRLHCRGGVRPGIPDHFPLAIPGTLASLRPATTQMPYTRCYLAFVEIVCCAQGKYVVLFFYPLDFTFVCPTEITAFSDQHAEFAKINTEVGLRAASHASQGRAATSGWLDNPACAAADPGRLRRLALLPPGLGADRCATIPSLALDAGPL